MVSIRRRKITLIVVMSLIILGVSAQFVQVAAQQQKELRLMHHLDPVGHPLGVLVDKYLKRFQEENPDIKLIVERAADLLTVLMTRYAGGDEPDVFRIEQSQAVPFWEAGQLAAVPADFAIEEDFVSSPIQTIYYPDGKYYGVPAATDAVGIYYNRKMFTEAGLDFPSDDWTWKDFENYAKKLTKRDSKGELTQSGYAPWMESQGVLAHMFWPFYWSNGGTWFGSEGEVDNLLTSAGIEALDFAFRKPFHEWKVASVDFYADGQEGFWAQKVAMYPCGPWVLGTINKYYPDIDYGVAPIPIPTPQSERHTVLGGWNWHVPRKKADYEPAWRVIKFMTSTEFGIERSETVWYLPVRKDVVEEMDYSKVPLGFYEFTSYLEFARRKPIQGPAIYDRAISAAAHNLMIGAIKSAKEAAQQIVDEYKFEMGI